MDQEREQERQRYMLCRLGFWFLSCSLVVACLTTLVALPTLFQGRPLWPWLQRSQFWSFLDIPVVWGSLVGAYLLWGRWMDSNWQRRAGLFLLMCTADAVLWLLEHGQALGLRTGDFGHEWLRNNIGQALGWAEFALIASLTCEVMVHLGIEQAAETGKATRSLAATGSTIWMLLFCLTTNWGRWPLEGCLPFKEVVLLILGSTMIWTITLIQSTALAIAATRQCSAVLAEMVREDIENDPLQYPSEEPGKYFHG